MISERQGFSLSGYIAAPALLILSIVMVATIGNTVSLPFNLSEVMILILTLLVFSLWGGFFMVQPNQGKVMTLFGSYVGTEKRAGLRWTIPVFMRKAISLRMRNFESGQIKVNDNQGNPIEIAAIVVWSVSDTAEAVFEVDDFESFVNIQSESALRNMASSYPYDQQDGEGMALRSDPQQISDILQQEIQARLGKAGVTVHESRISHLAYAQEIASAMLQRQQATAIISARSKIVEGAVGMVEMALERLQEKGVVELDEERKAAMVSNLLVVLCGDKNTQPVVNAGTLY